MSLTSPWGTTQSPETAVRDPQVIGGQWTFSVQVRMYAEPLVQYHAPSGYLSVAVRLASSPYATGGPRHTAHTSSRRSVSTELNATLTKKDLLFIIIFSSRQRGKIRCVTLLSIQKRKRGQIAGCNQIISQSDQWIVRWLSKGMFTPLLQKSYCSLVCK